MLRDFKIDPIVPGTISSSEAAFVSGVTVIVDTASMYSIEGGG